MKSFFLILSLILSVKTFAQLDLSFDKQEAKNLVAICNYWLNGKIEGVDSTYIDDDYKLLYESKLYKMDNRWQLWEKGEDAVVINLRGTTRNAISWMENFYAVMIPAEGQLVLPDSQVVDYKFAKDPRASVHIGWTMGLSFMMADILEKVKEVNNRGVYNIYITGHSQGGALAHLLRAAFEYLPDDKLSKKNHFKVYAFAPPKPGNRFFAFDYASYTSLKNPSYSLINTDDWVPQVPLSVQSPNNMTAISPFASIESNDFKIPLFKRMVVNSIYKRMKKPIKKSQKKFRSILGKKMEKQIKKKVGPFTTPKYRKDFSYFPVGIQLILQPIESSTDNINLKLFWQHLPAHYYQLIEQQY
ncbi:MAG: hypothetical protein JXR60_09105 [Bacteroidales bacterium]|nr:hypothetical protein [Bacteroidales bacterium]